jgi:hypothetical protein
VTAPTLTELSVAAYADTRGGHVHVRVFVGAGRTRGLAGSLVLRAEEWPLFRALLCDGPGPAVHVEVTEESP